MTIPLEDDSSLGSLLLNDFELFCSEKFNFNKLNLFLQSFVHGSSIEERSCLLSQCKKQFNRAAKSRINAILLCIIILNETPQFLNDSIVRELDQAMISLAQQNKFKRFLILLKDSFDVELLKKLDLLLESSKSPLFHLICLEKLENTRREDFNRLLMLPFQNEQLNIGRLAKVLLKEITFQQVWDKQVVQKNLLRNPEIIIPNLSFLIPALDGVGEEDCLQIASLLLSHLKSSNPVVSQSAAKLFASISNSNDKFIPLLTSIFNEKSILAETKLPIVKETLISNSDLFELYQKNFSKEINEELRKAVLFKMSLIDGRETELLPLLASLLNSSKVQDKRTAIPALLEIAFKKVAIDRIPNLKTILTTFFCNIETCYESIFVMKIFQLVGWSDSKVFNGQVDYLFKIFLNGALKFDKFTCCCLLESVPCAQSLVIALSCKFDRDEVFAYSLLLKRCNFEAEVEKCVKITSIWDQLIELEVEYNSQFKQHILRFVHSSTCPEKSFIFLVKIGSSFGKLQNFFYGKVQIEQLVKELRFEVAFDFLASLRNPSIHSALLKESLNFSRETFEKFINSSIMNFPIFVQENLLQVYPKLIECKLYFSIHLLLHSFRFESTEIFEQVRKSLFEVLVDNKLSSVSEWIEQPLPRSVSFFNLVLPVLQSTKRLNNDSLEKTLNFIQQYSSQLSLENCNLLALIELLFSYLKSCLLLHNQIESILKMFLEKNNFNSCSNELQTTLQDFYFSPSLLVRKYSLLLSLQLTLLTPQSVFHIWALKYDDEYDVSFLASEICSNDYFDLSYEALVKFEEYVFGSKFTFPDYVMRGYCSLFTSFPEAYGRNITKLLAVYQEYSTKGIHNIRLNDQMEREHVREIVSKFLLETCYLIGKYNFLPRLIEFFLAEIIDFEKESDEIISNFVDTLYNTFKQSPNMEVFVEFYKKIDAYPKNTKGKIIALCGLVRLFPRDDILFEVYLKKCVYYAAFPCDNVQNVVASYLSECWSADFTVLVRDSVIPKLTQGKDLWERRGAAYLISTFVMKMGLEFVGQLQIEQLILKESLQRTKEGIEGCLFLIELLSLYMQSAFEPYAIKFIPFLISCNGEEDEEIRSACSTCIPMVMKHVSQHGLCIILPIALKYLEEPEWKIKSGSALLLGSMSRLAPQLLSRNLSTIISGLSDALKVPHPQVQIDAKMALDSFVNQITTPEIKSLASALLATIANPSTIDRTLDAIMQTAFGHYLQENDLCLLIPVILIGLKKYQSSNTKKTSAQILGNVLKLVENDKVQPYIGSLLNSLLDAMTDCVAEVRSVTAKVVGFIFEIFQLHQSTNFDWLIPSLIEGMREGKSGNAQVLGEVLGSCPIEKFNSYLPILLEGCKGVGQQKIDVSRSVSQQLELSRSLFLNLFVYLASTLKESVYSGVKMIIFPVLLECLCDSSEKIREIALKASQLLLKVGASSTSSIEYDSQIIDLLCRGVYDSNYNIRIASLQLVHDFCSIISTSSDNSSYQELLSLIYISRMDPNPAVKVQAMQIWKNLVHNSAKTLKDILPIMLLNLIKLVNIYGGDVEFKGNVDKMIDFFDEHVQMAVNTIQEICSKIEEIVILRLLAIESYSHGYAFLLYFVLRGTTSKLCMEKESNRLLEVLSQLTNFNAFMPILQLIKHSLGKQIESVLIPTLISKLRSGETIKVENCLEIRGFMPAVLQIIIQNRSIVSENSLMLLRTVTNSTEIIPYAEDIFEFLLHTDFDGEHLDLIEEIAKSFINSIAMSYGMYDVLIENYTKKATKLNLHSAVFMLTFISLIIQNVKIDSCCNSFTNLFSNAIIFTDERMRPFLERFIATLPMEEWIFEILFNALKSAPQLTPNSDLLVSFAMKNMTGSSEEMQLVLLQILELISTKSPVKNFISLIGLLIRVLGEKRTIQVKGASIACINALTIQSDSMIKPFVPQLSRLIVRNLGQESDKVILKNSIDLLISLGPLLTNRIESVIGELSEQESYSYIAICELIKSTETELPIDSIRQLIQKSNKLNSPLISGTIAGLCIGNFKGRSEDLVDLLSEIESSHILPLYTSCSILSCLVNKFDQIKYDWSIHQLNQNFSLLQSDKESLYPLYFITQLKMKYQTTSSIGNLSSHQDESETPPNHSFPYLIEFSD